MNEIEFYLKGHESRGRRAYAEIWDELPELELDLLKNEKYKDNQEIIKSVEEIEIDCEQGKNEVYNYQYYKIIYFDNYTYFDKLEDQEYVHDSECEYSKYIAIAYKDEENETYD